MDQVEFDFTVGDSDFTAKVCFKVTKKEYTGDYNFLPEPLEFEIQSVDIYKERVLICPHTDIPRWLYNAIADSSELYDEIERVDWRSKNAT